MSNYPICQNCGEPYCPDCGEPVSAGQVGALKAPKPWDRPYPGTNHSYMFEFIKRLLTSQNKVAMAGSPGWKDLEQKTRSRFASPLDCLSQYQAYTPGIEGISLPGEQIVKFPEFAAFWQWVWDQVHLHRGIGMKEAVEHFTAGQVGALKTPKPWDRPYPGTNHSYMYEFLKRFLHYNNKTVMPGSPGWKQWEQQIRQRVSTPQSIIDEWNDNYQVKIPVQIPLLFPVQDWQQFWSFAWFKVTGKWGMKGFSIGEGPDLAGQVGAPIDIIASFRA